MGIGNFHAKRKRAILELAEGKKMAARLQTLLRNPAEEDGTVSAQELALQILRSFTVSLSVVSSCAESAQIAAVDCGGSSSSSADGSKKKPGLKDRRGCYKRRKTKDSWVIVASTMEDGCAWRKYGQKSILNSMYPRCYFRCTHKHDGCNATKQVQRIKEEPLMYQTTYMNHHTCTETQRAPHVMILADSDPFEPNLISFQSKQQLDNNNNQTFQPNTMIMSSVKQESKEDADEEMSSEAKSTVQNPWDDTTWLGSLEHIKPVWDDPMITMIGGGGEEEAVVSGFQSCESTSFRGFDVEVNQFGDMDGFNYFDGEIY